MLLLPGLFILAAAALAVLLRRRRAMRQAGFVALFAVLYVVSTPFVGTRLAASVEEAEPLDRPLAPEACGWVVVLTGGVHPRVPGYPEPGQPSQSSLERLRYGIALARETGAPLAIVGGNPLGGPVSEGAALGRVAREEFRIEPDVIEDTSRNTYEGAAEFGKLVPPDEAGTVCLATSASHMTRASATFREAGFEVREAPVGFAVVAPAELPSFVPSVGGLGGSSTWLSETLGAIVYRVRYAVGEPAEGT